MLNGPIEGVLGNGVQTRQRRHTALGMLTPVEFEARHEPTTAA
jgi:hypothetical protein